MSRSVASCAIAGIAIMVASVAFAADDYGIPQVSLINEKVEAGWRENGIKPSKPATDGEWCRRIHLDLIGRIPNLEELQRFLADSTKEKKAVVVDRLLGEEYEEEYARHWTGIWTTILIGRDVENEMVNRAG
ncbi:MAG: DUF1549 domain-containing protein, partial [Planctomycetaceae bacterium]